MKLADSEIKKCLSNGRISGKDIREEKITGVTLDVRLSNEILLPIPNDEVIDITDPNYEEKLVLQEIDLDNEELVLKPGDFVLGCLYEDITITDDLVAFVDGKSRLGRLGITVHITAHRVDPGWSGKVVLEIKNLGWYNVKLSKGMEIGALCFEEIKGKVETPYASRKDARYQNQTGTKA